MLEASEMPARDVLEHCEVAMSEVPKCGEVSVDKTL